jgi:hypothetical protein
MTAPDGPVLIVTMDDDSHADIMVEELNRRGVEVVRFHPEDFPVRSSVSLFQAGDGWDGELRTQGRSVLLSQVRSAWFRRPQDPVLSDAVPPSLKEFSLLQARDVLWAMYALLDDRWLASPHALRWAELKPLQLQAAARVGLRTIQTLVSNDREAVEQFRRRLAGEQAECAVKSLRSTRVITYDTKVWLPHTARWPADLSPDALDGIELTPAIYQRYLRKRLEVRAVVIEDQVLAASVDPSLDELSADDVRRGELTRHWQPFHLPADVAAALVRLTAGFGLHVSSSDLILTPDDELVFLELNPNGQWLWLDLYAGLPLVRMVADVLCGSFDNTTGREHDRQLI